MSIQEPKPQSCIVDPKRGLMYVKWHDQHESLIPLPQVRKHCPCANCRQIRENVDPLRMFDPNQIQPSTEVVAVEKLGSHALQLVWSDGHYAGLYPWGLLRSLCPCPACESNRASG